MQHNTQASRPRSQRSVAAAALRQPPLQRLWYSTCSTPVLGTVLGGLGQCRGTELKEVLGCRHIHCARMHCKTAVLGYGAGLQSLVPTSPTASPRSPTPTSQRCRGSLVVEVTSVAQTISDGPSEYISNMACAWTLFSSSSFINIEFTRLPSPDHLLLFVDDR